MLQQQYFQYLTNTLYWSRPEKRLGAFVYQTNDLIGKIFGVLACQF
jgi:hypothetical protein